MADVRSEEAAEYRRLYKLAVWVNPKHGRRAQKLREQPLCERCRAKGKVVPATVVNHRVPHKGDYALFADYLNLESTCEDCHNSTIQSEEKLGYSKEIGTDGFPADPRHPFNKAK